MTPTKQTIFERRAEIEKLNPDYYTQGGIECIDYIISKKLNFLEGNVVKYITRNRHKHKDGIEDLKKARWYLNRLIELKTKEGETDEQ
jgi:hypothetical protein|tara:strand:+ start:43 stop:306 length:264 start_codon:yes stop_codon:yes gene_type:complete